MITKKHLMVGGAVLGLALLWGSGYEAGRRSVSVNVAHTETKKTADAQVATTQAVNSLTNTKEAAQDLKTNKDQIVTRWRTKKILLPNGQCVGETEGERIENRNRSEKKADSKDTQTHVASTATSKSETHAMETSSTTIKTVVASPPRLMIGLGAGLSVPTLLGGTPDRQLLPFVPRQVAGIATVDARLIGNVYAGLWASTSGAAGLELRVGIR